MSNVEDYGKKISAQYDRLHKQREQDYSSSAQAIFPELIQAVQRWDEELKKRQEAFQGIQIAEPAHHTQPADQAVTPGLARSSAVLKSWLQELDAMMLDEFELRRFPLPGGFSKPIYWLENASILRQELSRGLAGAFLPDILLQGRGVLHIPGRGTFIDCAFFQSNETLDDVQRRAWFSGEVARERWGWGFLLEYTTLGKWAGKNGLWPALTAQRLGLALSNDPAQALAAALRQSWLLLEIGWDEWIWRFVQFKARQAVGAQVYNNPRSLQLSDLLEKLIQVFPIFVMPFGIRISLLDLLGLVKFLVFDETNLTVPVVHQWLLAAQKLCLENDALSVDLIGRRLSQVFSVIFYTRLEAMLGILSIPYAILIAMHVPDTLPTLSAEDFSKAVASEPHLCPDTRLALLAHLKPDVKYDPHAVFVAAWERCRLEGPREFFPGR